MTSESSMTTPAHRTGRTAHTPTPWTFDEVRTSCGRCFRIGSQEQLETPKAERGRLPAYACLYDDYGFGENSANANAAFIVQAVNSHEVLVEALESQMRATILLLSKYGYSQQEIEDCTSQARAALSASRSTGDQS